MSIHSFFRMETLKFLDQDQEQNLDSQENLAKSPTPTSSNTCDPQRYTNQSNTAASGSKCLSPFVDESIIDSMPSLSNHKISQLRYSDNCQVSSTTGQSSVDQNKLNDAIFNNSVDSQILLAAAAAAVAANNNEDLDHDQNNNEPNIQQQQQHQMLMMMNAAALAAAASNPNSQSQSMDMMARQAPGVQFNQQNQNFDLEMEFANLNHFNRRQSKLNEANTTAAAVVAAAAYLNCLNSVQQPLTSSGSSGSGSSGSSSTSSSNDPVFNSANNLLLSSLGHGNSSNVYDYNQHHASNALPNNNNLQRHRY